MATPLDASHMADLRSRVLEMIDAHENSEHNGEPCWAERCNVVGYFCHILGLDMEYQGDLLTQIVQLYRQHHDHRAAHPGESEARLC